MNGKLKIGLSIAGFILMIVMCWYFSTLITYIVIAAVLSVVGAPVVRVLRKIKIGYIKVSSSVAALITLMLFIFATTLILSLFAPLVAEEANIISQINVEATSDHLKEHLSSSEKWLENFNISGDERSNREFLIEKLQSLINFGKISSVFDDFFGLLGGAFIAIFSICFMAFFFLRDGYLLQKIIFSVTPEKHIEKVKSIQVRVNKLMSQYLIGVLIQVTITTTIISVSFLILGIENAMIIGLLAGMMNLIPYIGPIIGYIIAFILVLSTNFMTSDTASLFQLITEVSVIFLIAQLVDNLFTQPFVLGKSVRAHPLEIFIVISAAGTFGGVGAMILAIPVYTILKIIANEFLSGFKVVDNLTRSISEEED